MKLHNAPQAGLRRRKAEQNRQRLAFWGGLLILAAFELVLMSKSWSPASTERIFDFRPETEAAPPSEPSN